MCGILGRIELEQRIERTTFSSMLETLARRGPDGAGVRYFDDGRVALGHRRLAIIDLSEAGAQPMPNEDETLWLTYNGEIYNYSELRVELEASGHRFRSRSDSEVILHAHEEWGDSCVQRLRGIFAFGLWDTRRKRMLLARDHLGVKPLYYVHRAGCITFASQPRAILADAAFVRDLDATALRDYLAYGYVTHDRSIFAGIRKLLPGHRLVWQRGSIAVERYWRLDCESRIHERDEALESIRTQLTESTRLQMVSDVPIGIFLSGGIDSSCVAAIAARQARERIRAFTIGFEEPKNDERPFARVMSRHCNFAHTEAVLDFGTARGLLADVIDAYDEPFWGGSAFPTHFISRLSRQHRIKVILAGDGGDEVFAGYLRYDRYQERRAFSFKSRLAQLAAQALGREKPDPVEAYFALVGLMPWALQERVFTSRIANHLDPDVCSPLRRFFLPDVPAVKAAQYMDLHTFLPDHILYKVDRASMATGVEVRVPLLDPQLVELGFRITDELIYRSGERKAIFKDAVADWLPDALLTTRKKGFSIPIQAWMNGGLEAVGRDIIQQGSLVERGIFDRDGVDQVYGKRYPRLRWLLLAAELWARRWLEAEPKSAIESLW